MYQKIKLFIQYIKSKGTASFLVKVFEHLFYPHKKIKKFKYNLSIVLCVKDESSYLQEFIEYHKLMGVDHFYIYNNNGTDNSKDILLPYIKAGLVTYQDYPGIKVQNNIYENAVNNYKYETKWMMIIDIDEFVLPLKHKNIPAFLKDYDKFSEICIHWMLYGDSGQKKRKPGLVIERFTHNEGVGNKHVKSVFNPRKVFLPRIHYSFVWGKSVDENKQPVYSAIDNKAPVNIIRINHYVIKSWEEFINKKNRGRASSPNNELSKQFYDNHNKNNSSDNLMKSYANKIYKIIDKKK